MKKDTQTKAQRGNPASTPRLPPRRRLKSAQDLRQFMGDLLNRVNRGEIDQGQARCMAYIGQVLGGLIERSDLEKRLEALEAQAKENGR